MGMHGNVLRHGLFACLLYILALSQTRAATLLVNSSDDDFTTGNGLVTLREALIAANADQSTDLGHLASGPDRVEFQLTTSTIRLQQSLPAITSEVEIAGPAAAPLAIAGNTSFRLLQIDKNATATLSRLILTAGRAETGGALLNAGSLTMQSCAVTNSQDFGREGGGGICNTGRLDMTDCLVSGNQLTRKYSADDYGGAGIRNQLGKLTMRRCVVTGNFTTTGIGGYGGGIMNLGQAQLEDCSFSNNQCWYRGAGIMNGPFNTYYYPTCTLKAYRCSFSANAAGVSGGGMNNCSSATLVNCSLLENSAGMSGGGINTEENLTLVNCTIAYNQRTNMNYFASAGGLSVEEYSALAIGNTLVAGNTANSGTPDYSNKYGPVTDLGHNFIGIGQSGYAPKNGLNGNIVGTGAQPANPAFAGLQTTSLGLRVAPLQSNSGAVDAGDNALIAAPYFIAPPFTDALGNPRLNDGDGDRAATVDIGAIEYQRPLAARPQWRLYR